MHSVKHPGKTIGDFCRPDQMALIVYDMQIGIMRQLPDGAGITARVLSVLTSARASNFPVIFMRHMSMPLALMGAFQRRQAMAWQRIDDSSAIKPWFLRGSEGFEIVPELQPRADEAVIDKITFSAFEGTPLSIILRDLGLTSFAICGVATEIGIEPTVRHGADLGLVPLVIEDACGPGHAEAAERSFASMAFMGDALICQSADFIAATRQA